MVHPHLLLLLRLHARQVHTVVAEATEDRVPLILLHLRPHVYQLLPLAVAVASVAHVAVEALVSPLAAVVAHAAEVASADVDKFISLFYYTYSFQLSSL